MASGSFPKPEAPAPSTTAETVTRPATAPETGADTAVPPPWVTILWNCECHTFEQVANQLVKAIGCSYDEGMAIAWRGAKKGRAWGRSGPRARVQARPAA